MAFSLLVLAGWMQPAFAQTWAPIPVQLGSVPLNRTSDLSGNSYSFTATTLSKTSPAGVVTTLATAQSSPLGYSFTGVTVDGAGNVFAAETISFLSYPALNTSNGELILKVAPDGSTTTLNVTSSSVAFGKYPNSCTVSADNKGNVYTVGVDGSIYVIQSGGTQLTVASDVKWFYDNVGNYPDPPDDLSVDNQGDVFVSVINLNPTRYGGNVEFVPLTSTPLIAFQPQGATIPFGSSQTISVVAWSTAPLNYQWYLNGAAIPGATGSSFDAMLPGSYNVIVSTATGSVTSGYASITAVTSGGISVVPAPTITSQPQGGVFSFGSGGVNLSIAAVSTLPIDYQWLLNGAILPGANGSTFTATVPGSYTAVVTTSAGSVTSAAGIVTLGNRLAEVSSRAAVGTGGNVSIAGFVVGSYLGFQKQVLIRAVGPSLSQFGLTGILAEPVLSVFDSNGNLVASNAGWSNSTVISSADTAVGAFPLQQGSADSALVLTLAPGAYTAEVAGSNGSTGIALVEVYEIAADGGHFINLSTRAVVGTGAGALIGGIVTTGSLPSSVLIRAVGPGLTAFGVTGVLAQPVLSIYDSGGQLVGVDTGWSAGDSNNAVEIASAASAVGAFPLQNGSADCAVLLTLPPGAYTAVVTGLNASTGVVLIEAYQVPQ